MYVEFLNRILEHSTDLHLSALDLLHISLFLIQLSYSLATVAYHVVAEFKAHSSQFMNRVVECCRSQCIHRQSFLIQKEYIGIASQWGTHNLHFPLTRGVAASLTQSSQPAA